MNKLSRKRLVDGLIEAYVNWREACLRVSDAYRCWSSETGRDGATAFGWYMAALDDEEQAAAAYAALLRRARLLAWPADRPDSPACGTR